MKSGTRTSSSSAITENGAAIQCYTRSGSGSHTSSPQTIAAQVQGLGGLACFLLELARRGHSRSALVQLLIDPWDKATLLNHSSTTKDYERPRENAAAK
eukprot:64734-Amphidinium_carterae.1